MNFNFQRLVFFLLLPLTGLAQNLQKDSIQVNAYLKEVDKSKTTPRLFTITDAAKVAFISNYVEAKSKLVKDTEERQKATIANQPGVRYKNGDKTVVPEIVAILKSRDSLKISDVLSQMTFDYSADAKQRSIESEIFAQIAALTDVQGTEWDASQYLGYNHIEGGIPVLEKQLISGKSKFPDRMFYWIAQSGQVSASIDFIAAQYKRNPKYFEDNSGMADAMGDAMEKASDADKAKILEITYDYLEKNIPVGIVPERDGDEALGGESYKDFYNIALKYGQKDKMKSILNKMVTIMNERSGKAKVSPAEMDQILDILFIKDAEPAKQKKVILATIMTPDMFFEGLEMMQKIPALENDPDMLGKVFRAFEYSSAKDEKEQFIKAFPKLSAVDFNKYVDGMSSPSFRQEVMEIYNINAKTFEQNNDELIALGLTGKKITDADITEFKKKNQYFEKENSMYSVLEVSGINVNFDAEADEMPVDYSGLLTRFSEASQGKLGPLKTYVQTSYNKKKQVYDYRFFVVCNNKCFVMVPEDMGDYYDVAALDNLIVTLSDELKLTEKFVSVNSGDEMGWYIFGQPDKVKQLIQNYKLSADPIDEE